MTQPIPTIENLEERLMMTCAHADVADYGPVTNVDFKNRHGQVGSYWIDTDHKGRERLYEERKGEVRGAFTGSHHNLPADLLPLFDKNGTGHFSATEGKRFVAAAIDQHTNPGSYPSLELLELSKDSATVKVLTRYHRGEPVYDILNFQNIGFDDAATVSDTIGNVDFKNNKSQVGYYWVDEDHKGRERLYQTRNGEVRGAFTGNHHNLPADLLPLFDNNGTGHFSADEAKRFIQAAVEQKVNPGSYPSLELLDLSKDSATVKVLTRYDRGEPVYDTLIFGNIGASELGNVDFKDSRDQIGFYWFGEDNKGREKLFQERNGQVRGAFTGGHHNLPDDLLPLFDKNGTGHFSALEGRKFIAAAIVNQNTGGAAFPSVELIEGSDDHAIVKVLTRYSQGEPVYDTLFFCGVGLDDVDDLVEQLTPFDPSEYEEKRWADTKDKRDSKVKWTVDDGDALAKWQKNGIFLGNTVHLHNNAIAQAFANDGNPMTLTLNQAGKGQFAGSDPAYTITKKERVKGLSLNVAKNLIDAYKAGYQVANTSFEIAPGYGIVIKFDNGRGVDEILLTGAQFAAWLM